jgi:transcriptional regulator with XRE-family HTH domain
VITPLQRIREKRGFTQRQVANDNDIDPGQYNRIEKGTYKLTPIKAERLSIYFGGAITELELLYPERFAREDPPTNEAA